jgi:hypothetical protein
LFSCIDTDGSKTIDREETLKYWSTSFAKLNSQELFSQVDVNGDGTIQEDEWVQFWESVYNSGHYSEEEICAELDNLINKGSWVKFETGDKKRSDTKKRSLKAQGKV